MPEYLPAKWQDAIVALKESVSIFTDLDKDPKWNDAECDDVKSLFAVVGEAGPRERAYSSLANYHACTKDAFQCIRKSYSEFTAHYLDLDSRN